MIYFNMNKQQLARQRNWQKFKLTGITLNKHVFTEEEQEELIKIKTSILKLLNNWDDNSEKLGLTPSKYGRCSKCLEKHILYNSLCKTCFGVAMTEHQVSLL